LLLLGREAEFKGVGVIVVVIIVAIDIDALLPLSWPLV
jgi:hypothetical protein